MALDPTREQLKGIRETLVSVWLQHRGTDDFNFRQVAGNLVEEAFNLGKGVVKKEIPDVTTDEADVELTPEAE
jgi:hypothetical protein